MTPTATRCGRLHFADNPSAMIGKADCNHIKEGDPAMDQELEGGDVTFIDFPTVAAGGTRSAAIATFPPPPGPGRPRHVRAPSVERDERLQLLGRSPGIVEVTARLRRIAPSQAAVML